MIISLAHDNEVCSLCFVIIIYLDGLGLVPEVIIKKNRLLFTGKRNLYKRSNSILSCIKLVLKICPQLLKQHSGHRLYLLLEPFVMSITARKQSGQ